MVVDGRRPGEPHLFPLRMADDVLQRLAEHAEPVGLPHDHRVQGDAAYQRLFCRLAQQFFELTNDEVTEFFRRVMPHQNLRAVVDLDRVRNAHDWTGARLHPERLIVGRPVHQEIEPDLLQEVGRVVRRRHPWRHPASRRLSGCALDRVTNLLQESPLVSFPHVAMTLRVGAAMPNEFVAARFQCVGDTGRIVENRRVDQVSRRKIQFIEQFEAAPNANPVAVIAPGEGPGVRSRSCYGQKMTFARAEGEVFDVEAEIDRQPLAIWPGVVRTVNDRRISIAIMIWKLHIGIPAKPGSARLAHWRRPAMAEDPMMVDAATVFVVTAIAKSTGTPSNLNASMKNATLVRRRGE